jgi:thiol-disulfide isomerase/thioredoxin
VKLTLFLVPLLSLGQVLQPPSTQISDEDDHLRSVLSETNGSAVDVIRAFEVHLKKFPTSPKRGDIEKALVKSAIEIKDDPRIVEYGERVLEREADLQVLDRVTGVLLGAKNITKSMAERGLKYARQFEELVLQIEKEPAPPNRRDAARKKDEVDRGLSRSLGFQARALAILGKADESIAAARRSFERNPCEASAHELGFVLARAGKYEEAAKAYVDAFTVPDTKATDAEREANRKLMSENWRKAKNTEAGLGDLLLPAYDRNRALVTARRKVLRDMDPNREATNAMDFTLTGINGDALDLKSLRGKIVVLDFWATWCGPCRGQYPLYEEVKKKYKNRSDVVFLGINTDEDQTLVKPFVEAQKWNKAVYFEDGLARLLRVESIPSTMIFDRQGQLSSRMNGYVPDRFVEMLASRIDNALEDGIQVKAQ